MIIAAAICLVVHKLRIGVDRSHIGVAILQIPVRRPVLIYEVIKILVMSAGQPVLLDAVTRGGWIQPIAIDNVVADDGVVINNRSRKGTVIIAIADQYSAIVVVKDGVVGDGYLIGRMPGVNTPTFAAVHKIVPDVPTQVGVVDAMMELVGRVDVSNVVHNVADYVVVMPTVVVVIVDAATVNARGGVMAQVVNVVADNTNVGSVVDDAVARRSVVAGDVKALDVDVISLVSPDDTDRGRSDSGAPLLVGDEANAARGCAAGLGGDRAGVGAWSYVYYRSRLRDVRRVLDGCPGTLLGAAVGVIPVWGHIVIRSGQRRAEAHGRAARLGGIGGAHRANGNRGARRRSRRSVQSERGNRAQSGTSTADAVHQPANLRVAGAGDAGSKALGLSCSERYSRWGDRDEDGRRRLSEVHRRAGGLGRIGCADGSHRNRRRWSGRRRGIDTRGAHCADARVSSGDPVNLPGDA